MGGPSNNNPLDVKLNLEPLGFSSPGGYELLKVLDNTIALFRQGKYRTSDEIRLSQAILQTEDTSGGDIIQEEPCQDDESMLDADEKVKHQRHELIPPTDDELIQYEEKLFAVSEASNRQLWLNTLRSDTDMFLIFADWAEKQRRKLLDPILRNTPLWDTILGKKQDAVSELNKLFQVFNMLRLPPASGTPPGNTQRQTEALKQKTRQMCLLAAINASNPKGELEQALLCSRLRADRLLKVEKLIQTTIQLIKEGVEQQKIFLCLIDELRSKWNVVKIPYENQVFSGSDTDYPYRGELWVELLHVPSDVWGIDLLDDPLFNIAPQLWKSADEAGYQVHLHCHGQDENEGEQAGGVSFAEQAESHQDAMIEWREKRTRRRYGNPFYCSPPVPVSSPFDSQWVEIYITAKKDEEKLPKEAQQFLHRATKKIRKGAKKKVIPEIKEDEDKDFLESEGVNIIAKFNGDMGAAVRECRKLTCEITLKSVRWEKGHSSNLGAASGAEPPNKKVKRIDHRKAAEEEDRMTDQDQSMDEPYSTSRRIARDVFHNLNDYLMVAQRTCMERTLYAIIQSQGMRMLRELTYPLLDDESLTSVMSTLKSRVASLENLDNKGILIRPLVLSEKADIACNPNLRPNHLCLPVSWPCWPIMATPKHSSPPMPPTTSEPPLTRAGSVSSQKRLQFLAARKKVTVTSCDSDSISFALHEIPLFVASSRPKCPPTVAGECDVLVTIKFTGAKKTRRHRSKIIQDQGFHLLFNYLEEMSVCKLRQLFLETLNPLIETFPRLLFDLHPSSLAYTRRSNGPLLLNDFHSWLFSQISMGFYSNNQKSAANIGHE